MRLSAQFLADALGCSFSRAQQYAPTLEQACAQYEINTPLRLAHFLAQVAHESGALRHTVEIWGPTPAQQRYEGRHDLGNTQRGDGERYKGRGLIQTTGRANYSAVTHRLRRRFPDAPDFEAEPQKLEQLPWSVLSAADYWDMRSINAAADKDDVRLVTRLVNGGLNGLADREERLARIRAALHRSAQTPTENSMNSFAALALDSVFEAVPKLVDAVRGDKKERSAKLTELVVGVAKDAVNARNEQELVETLKSSPEAQQRVKEAIEGRWFEIMEAGGGGIAGARKFIAESTHPMTWHIVSRVTYAALTFLFIANLIAVGAWGVAMWTGSGVESATQILVQVIAADILSATSAISFWLGSSFGSRQKDEKGT